VTSSGPKVSRRTECKANAEKPLPPPDQPQRGLLSVRSALVLTLALIAAACGALLLAAAVTPSALIALGAFGIFASAVTLIDRIIE
jgi:hypothetical protein